MPHDRLPADVPTILFGDYLLRRIGPGDAADLYAYWSDPDVTALTSTVVNSMDDIAAAIQYSSDAWDSRSGVRWAICQADSGRIVGDCGYNNFDQRHNNAVIGYQVAKEHWGRGLATRAVNEMLRWGFATLDLHRVEATVHPENSRSARVLEKLGFRREGLLRDYRHGRNGYFDCILFGLLRPEWTDIG